jgi:hypothetical protein
MRENLYLFLIRAFQVLFPGETLVRAHYVEAMCYALQRVASGQCQRLMISIAPRHLKSICGSVLLPAFILGRDPSQKIIVVSYGKDLGREQAELFRKLVENPFFKLLFPRFRLDPRHNRHEHIKTTAGGGRKVPRGRAGEDALTRDIIALASQYGRYGYRRIAILLRDAGWAVNAKRVERIWRRAGHRVPRKQPKKSRLWLNDGSCIPLRPERPNHVWSYDFVEARTHDGRKFRMLNLIDEFTRECLAIRIDRKLRSTDVIDVLFDLFILRGVGTELTYQTSANVPIQLGTRARTGRGDHSPG